MPENKIKPRQRYHEGWDEMSDGYKGNLMVTIYQSGSGDFFLKSVDLGSYNGSDPDAGVSGTTVVRRFDHVSQLFMKKAEDYIATLSNKRRLGPKDINNSDIIGVRQKI